MSQLAEIESRLLPMEPLIDKLGGDLSQSIKHVESVPTEACNNNGKCETGLVRQIGPSNRDSLQTKSVG